jgi:hypothetical protein
VRFLLGFVLGLAAPMAAEKVHAQERTKNLVAGWGPIPDDATPLKGWRTVLLGTPGLTGAGADQLIERLRWAGPGKAPAITEVLQAALVRQTEGKPDAPRLVRELQAAVKGDAAPLASTSAN